jgi:hypothetical protein
MSIGNLFGTGSESNSLYGTSLTSNGASSFIYFEWFIFKVSTGQPATPTGGSWDFATNTGTPPTGWTSTVSGVPLNNLWFCIAFVDSRNPTNIVWSTTSLLASSTSIYATAYADTFTGNGSTTNWTLTTDPVVVNNLDVSINGVTQTPTVDYTISGTTFTTTTAAPLGAIILVKYRQALPNSYYGTSNNVGYTPAGTGAVATNVQAKLRQYVSVKDFGAVGDGTTDDTVAIQAALDAVSGTGLTLLIPPSTSFYRITATLYPKSNTTIWGYGATIKNSGTSVFTMIWVLGTAGSANYLTDVNILGLTVDCNGTVLDSGGSGIGGSYCNNLRIRDCKVKNAWLQGIFFARGGKNCWIESNYVERAWGDGIHIGDQYTGETLENVWITDNFVYNSFDDGIGVTGGAHLVWITNNKVDTVTAAAGIDLSGCYQTYVQGNYVTGYGQIGIRVQRFNASQCFDIEILDNIIDGPPANQAAINLFGPNNTNVSTFALNPITIRDNRIKNVTATGSYGIFVTGAGMVTIDSNFIEGNQQGIVLSGLPATSTVGPIVNCKIRNNRFSGLNNAIGLSSGNNDFSTAANEFISCANVMIPNSAAYWVQPTIWEADYKYDDTFFKGITYTTTGTSQTEIDSSTRIKVTRGQRVQLNYFAQDVSGSGLGDSTIQLYDVTNSAVLATATITGNTSAYAWRTLDVALIATDAELTVRYGRTFAGGSLSIKGAYARIG